MSLEEAIDSFLREMLYESWMDEEDYQYVITETFKSTGITKDDIIRDLQKGVENGYSIEDQLEIAKKALSQYKGGNGEE